MQKSKIKILSTRLLDDEFIRDAEIKDVLVDVIPFIKTEPISSPELQKKIQETSAMSTTIVFTSTNAVEAVATEINDQEINWKIFCIGHSTKQSVVKIFGESSIAEVADNAKELAEVILRADVAELIFFCGDQRRNELPDQLKKNNIKATEIVVYKTILTPQKIEKKYDGILFFSPSAVKSFFQLNQLNDEPVLFAIGNTTAEEIKKFSKNKILVSDVPDREALMDKVISYFQMNPIHH
jgi:uroporphyrinogen-III synthase